MNYPVTESSKFKIQHDTDPAKEPDQKKEDQDLNPSQREADENETDRSFLMQGRVNRNFTCSY